MGFLRLLFSAVAHFVPVLTRRSSSGTRRDLRSPFFLEVKTFKNNRIFVLSKKIFKV